MEGLALSAAVDASMQWYDHSTAIFLAERLLAVAHESDTTAPASLGSITWWHALHTLATAYYRSAQASKAYALLKHSTLSVALLSPTLAAQQLKQHSGEEGELWAWMDRVRYLFALCW
jgi:hypothetical protein